MQGAENKLTTLNDWALYCIALTGGFLSEHWAELFFVLFAGVHAFVALDKWRYERSLRTR